MGDHLYEAPEFIPADRGFRPRRPPIKDVPAAGGRVLDVINSERIVTTPQIERRVSELSIGEVDDLCRYLHHQGAIKWFGGDWYTALGVTTDEVNKEYRKRETRRDFLRTPK